LSEYYNNYFLYITHVQARTYITYIYEFVKSILKPLTASYSDSKPYPSQVY